MPQLYQPRASVEAELAERIRVGEELMEHNISTGDELDHVRTEYGLWDDFNKELLRRRFTTTEFADEYARPVPRVGFVDAGLNWKVNELREDLERQVTRLKSIRERLQFCEEPEARSRSSTEHEPGSGSIFVVHGHAEDRRESVARFLQEAVDVPVVILHEQADQARTLIEKLEDVAAEASFAVVLLTADDVGGRKPEEGNAPELGSRARQNVILEAGYFMSALGRSAVVLLYEEGVELPSDMGGMLYTPFDPAGAWKMKLGRELYAAGIDFDSSVLTR